MSELKRFIEERKLTRIKIDRKLVLKEIDGTISDLEEARDSLARKKFKWQQYKATTQCFTPQEHFCTARDQRKEPLCATSSIKRTL